MPRFAEGRFWRAGPLCRHDPEPWLAKVRGESESRRVKPKPTELPQEQPPIKLSVNTVLDSKFIPAGELLPVSSADDLPESLKPFVVVPGGDEPEVEEQAPANYELGVTYQVNSDGRLGRVIARQVAQMEEENELRDYIEERLSAELPREVSEALQAASEESVSRQMAEAESRARRADMADEAGRKFIDEQNEEVNEL